MIARARALAVVVALGVAGAAHAGDKRRDRPASAKITPPAKLAKIKLPKGLQKQPPADRWWEGTAPCPGAELKETENHGWIRHFCVDADGADHGPYSSISPEGETAEDGWRKHGAEHGLQRKFYGNNPYEQKLYVDGVAHGDAVESRDRGPYRNGERHGLWKLHTDGGGEVRGYFVDGKRQGTWLGVTTDRHREEVVVARATYKNDAITGEVAWWTERGDLLATITRDYAGSWWQFYGGGGAKTLSAGCMGDQLTNVVMTRKGKTLTCNYDPDSGVLVTLDGSGGSTTTSAGTCPATTTGGLIDGSLFCSGEPMDPWAMVNAISRAGLMPGH